MNSENWTPYPVKYERDQLEDGDKSRDGSPYRPVFKEEHSIFRYCKGNLNFSAASLEEDEYISHKKKISRDPMSHRIIEKRRRDRMNNCLADLSRLIPAEYLKKGRGRIEKTEIIEMAIKHMRHLQNIISSSRLNESNDLAASSPSAQPTATQSTSSRQPIVAEHYRLGYMECLSEAMHFLVEVRGFFAGDSLCVEMINHLHKHCDKILKGDALNFPRKHTRETSSSSSNSTSNGNYSNNSPPLGMSNSTSSNSDDNPMAHQYEPSDESYRRYPEMCYQKNHSQRPTKPMYPRYVESEQIDTENRSDSEMEQTYVLNPRSNFEPKQSYNQLLHIPRNYSISSGIGSAGEATLNYEDVNVKEETPDGLSQLREMLTSPKSTTCQLSVPFRNPSDVKGGDRSPISHNSGCDSSLNHYSAPPEAPYHKYKDPEPEPQLNHESCNSDTSDNHNNHMYKFKNNIKQRFSKESHLDDQLPKKPKMDDSFPEALTKERLHLLETESEKRTDLRFTTTTAAAAAAAATTTTTTTPVEEPKNRHRFPSESEIESISNRLSFGHKAERKQRWDDAKFQKLPDPSISCKLNKYASESGIGIPIFALHSKGSFYIPLKLDPSALGPFLSLLGVSKSDDVESKSVLHPVTISVNYSSQFDNKQALATWKCPS